MRSVAITCARNEADIIEAFVRHTLAFCDTAIVLDHGSADATPEILRRLQEEGLPLHVLRDDTIGRIQVDHMNRLLRMAAGEFAADWVLCLDADEFISGCADGSFLPAPVDETTPCLKLSARTYYCQRDDPAGVLNPVERITRRLAREPDAGDAAPHKVFVPGPLARRAGAWLAPGNHLLRIDGVEAPSRVPDDVRLAHFSLRTPGQYAIKVASKRLHAHRFISPLGDEGAHYEEAYARMAESYSRFSANFFDERLPYLPPHDTRAVVRDPLRYLGGRLRYTEPAPDLDHFARQLLSLAEALAATGGGPDGNGGGSHPANVYPLLNIEIFAQGARGISRACEAGARRALEFPLDLPPGAGALHLRAAGEPGMLEIGRLRLVYPGTPPAAREFDAAALRKNLRVVSDAAILQSGSAFRLLVSREPAVLAFRDWKLDGATPCALRIEARFDDRLDKAILLHPATLNAMNRDTASREISGEKLRLLQDRVKYTPGTPIDFTESGDAVLFTREGWCHPEPWGTWIEGDEGVLKIQLDRIPERDVTLSAAVKGLVSRSLRTVEAGVHINGEALAKWEMNSGEFKPYRLIIPAAKLQSGECVIAFKIRDPRSPAQLGLGGDKRLLSLGFERMTLDF